MKTRYYETVRYLTILALSLVSLSLALKVKELEARPIEIVYQVDSAGAVGTGVVTSKSAHDGRYTLTISGYGNFLVTKEQYEAVKVGDDIPDYLQGRGS